MMKQGQKAEGTKGDRLAAKEGTHTHTKYMLSKALTLLGSSRGLLHAGPAQRDSDTCCCHVLCYVRELHW
jgi:hypothetical protein